MFLAAIQKEFTLVLRDLHSVLVLFVMPSAFIIIMSLAMQEEFSDKSDFSLSIKYYNAEKNPYTTEFLTQLNSNKHFEFIDTQGAHSSKAKIDTLGDSKAYIEIPTNLVDLLQADKASINPVEIWFSPNVDTRTRLLIQSTIKESLVKTKLSIMQVSHPAETKQPVDFIAANAIRSEFLYREDGKSKAPTSVQQSVPAWLIFSMFFVVIPISTTLVTERQQGTLTRLRTMNISMGSFLSAKALPYLVINQIQLVLMLLLGAYLIPVLGGDKLVIGSAYSALALMSLAVGFSAVGYALLIAVVAKTTEQATSIGGIGNILLGAIGGIMVPKFVMPEYLQKFTAISPMSWGLDGFLDIFLYGNTIAGVLAEIAMLLSFGIVMFAVALVIFQQQRQG